MEIVQGLFASSQMEKAQLFISCWISSDYAICLNAGEFQEVILGADPACSVSHRIRHHSSSHSSSNNTTLTALDCDDWEINYAHTTLPWSLSSFHPVGFLNKKKTKVTVNKFAGCQQPSAVTQLQGQKYICQNLDTQHYKLLSLVNWNYFSLLTSVLAFHLARKLNLRSSSLPVSSLKKEKKWKTHIESTNKPEPTAPTDEFLVLWCSKLYFSPLPARGYIPIINKHEAEQFLSDIWKHFAKGFLH